MTLKHGIVQIQGQTKKPKVGRCDDAESKRWVSRGGELQSEGSDSASKPKIRGTDLVACKR